MPSVISHDRVSLDFTDQKSRTKQSFIEETDVNTIMGRWRRTGVIEHLAKAEPRYGDFATTISLQCKRSKTRTPRSWSFRLKSGRPSATILRDSWPTWPIPQISSDREN